MDAESITLDNTTFKALASETRVAILKTLDARRKTASELAHELGATVQGISEHLHSLQQAGLVERKESGRKWVYYQLTAKGSAVLHPDSKKFWVLVSLSFLALFSYFASPYLLSGGNSNAMFAQDASVERMALTTPDGTPAPQTMAAAKTTQAGAQEAGVAESDQAIVESAPQAKAASSISNNEALFLIAAAFFLAGAGWIKFVKKSA